MDNQVAAAGEELVIAAKNNLKAISGAARMIAAICDAKADNRLPLLAGDKDALPSLQTAIGSGLTASRDLHKAQLHTMQMAKRVGWIITADDVPSCPCAGMGHNGSVALATVDGKSVAA